MYIPGLAPVPTLTLGVDMPGHMISLHQSVQRISEQLQNYLLVQAAHGGM